MRSKDFLTTELIKSCDPCFWGDGMMVEAATPTSTVLKVGGVILMESHGFGEDNTPATTGRWDR